MEASKQPGRIDGLTWHAAAHESALKCLQIHKSSLWYDDRGHSQETQFFAYGQLRCVECTEETREALHASYEDLKRPGLANSSLA